MPVLLETGQYNTLASAMPAWTWWWSYRVSNCVVWELGLDAPRNLNGELCYCHTPASTRVRRISFFITTATARSRMCRVRPAWPARSGKVWLFCSATSTGDGWPDGSVAAADLGGTCYEALPTA